MHTSFAFKSALSSFVATGSISSSITNKMHNDDMDVTKGCQIIVTISHSKESLSFNPIEHKPYIIIAKHSSIEIYAGLGVGVVTKKGLKPPQGYPAINPVPLQALEDIFTNKKYINPKRLYCSIGVMDGQKLALQTANAKVGVVGGISILGTTGFVKPVSSEAYIDSIKTQIEFIEKNHYDRVVFTIGSSSLKYAQGMYAQESIVEIGNFIYDAISIVTHKQIDSIVLVCGIGKMTKIYQGFKNSHNRFGMIDFVALRDDIVKELGIELDIESIKTMRGLSEDLDRRGQYQELISMIEWGAKRVILDWFPNIDIDVVIPKIRG